MMSSLNQICRAYETFGECRYGRNCTRSHNDWPYRTRTTVATIVTEDIELPGVIAFLIKSDDRDARTQRYYISKGRWFSADAAPGDVVEILISEKIHQWSGCCCARICKILESGSTSRIPPLLPAGFREQHNCLDFLTYRDCKWGTRCMFTHDITASYNQRFHVAEVLSVISFSGQEMHVDVKIDRYDHVSQSESRRYFIPNKFSCNLSKGSLVIVQVSARMHESGLHFGKIITILHESQELGKSEVPLEVSVKSAFLLPDTPTRSAFIQRKDAYSMENCSDHSNCQRIGVHFRAAALGVHFEKLDMFFVPLHKTNIRDQPRGFDVDSIRLALTMYAHSKSDDVEGPFLTPVLVRPECVYTFNDAQKYQGNLGHLWLVFGVEFINAVVNSMAASYMVDFPKTWKERYIVRQMIYFFDNEITKYLRSKDERFVIVRNMSLHSLGNSTPIAAKDVVILAENLKMVESAWQSSASSHAEEKTIALGFLLGSVKRSTQEFWEEQLYDRYKCDVVSCDNLQDNQSVMVTSPIGQTADFLNQQAVLSLMISPYTPALYSKNELLGILARRYDTPVILKAVVRELTKTRVYLQFRGIFGRRRGNRLLWLDQIFKCPTVDFSRSTDTVGGDSDDESVDTVSLLLGSLTTDEYCNSRLVRLSGEQIAALAVTTLQQGVEASETASDIRALISTREEYDAPYQLNENGTLVTLASGVELQLQVAFREDDDENDHWLRLLRVGNGCHLCLVHLNFPVWAFLSGRVDITDLITQSSMEQMKEQIACNNLKTVTLREITIEWNDVYFSGGAFKTTTLVMPRNLLCIRKEIKGAEENSIYVWTCHAVVSEICDNEAKFIVSSLYQELTSEVWNQIKNGNFIVEVIDIGEENAPDL